MRGLAFSRSWIGQWQSVRSDHILLLLHQVPFRLVLLDLEYRPRSSQLRRRAGTRLVVPCGSFKACT